MALAGFATLALSRAELRRPNYKNEIELAANIAASNRKTCCLLSTREGIAIRFGSGYGAHWRSRGGGNQASEPIEKFRSIVHRMEFFDRRSRSIGRSLTEQMANRTR